MNFVKNHIGGIKVIIINRKKFTAQKTKFLMAQSPHAEEKFLPLFDYLK